MRVLVIDDTPCFREAAIELLQLRGYDVVGWVGSGAEALDAAERLDPDAVLLDVGLPDIDGFALAAELKRTHADLAVLVVSADQPHRLPCDSGVPFALKCDLINVDFGLHFARDRVRLRGDAEESLRVTVREVPVLS